MIAIGWAAIAPAAPVATAPPPSPESSRIPLMPDGAYAAPARLVAMQGGRRLNILCLGRGSPTVVLESGLGWGTIAWRKVQAGIAAFTQVCSYDRAGLGFSDALNRAADAANATDDLHRLLKASGIRGPVVLVGHSYGGYIIRLYAHLYADQVAGLVFVDQSGVNSFRDVYAILTDKEKADARRNFRKMFVDARRCVKLAEQGKIAAGSSCALQPVGDAALDAALLKTFSQAKQQRAELAESRAFNPPNADGVQSIDTLQAGAAPPAFGNRPVVVITTGGTVPPGKRGERLTAAGMAESQLLASASRRGRILQVHSEHDVPDQRPDVVLGAVREVVEVVRSAKR